MLLPLAPFTAVRNALVVALFGWLVTSAGAAGGRCVDEQSFDRAGAPATQAASAASPAVQAAVINPRAELQSLVREALGRSKSIGMAKLMAEAALQDTEEMRAARKMQASTTFSIGPSISNTGGVTDSALLQGRGGVTLSQLLYDGGRNERLVSWRSQLAEAARFGQLNAQEQLVLNTVSLALERSRFRLHAQVYGQYVRKMGCLVDALDQIVTADKGRLSELVQAQKSLQQAEISQSQAVSQARQIEIRLRRLIGDGLPAVEGLSTLLLAVPDVAVLQAEAAGSSEIAQFDATAAAMKELARSVEAGEKPQVSWTVGGSANAGPNSSLGSGRAAALNAGLTVNIPLLNPGLASASEAARKRAQAAALQRTDALESRHFRIAEVHEQTTASFDHARRVAAVLRDSERVRNFTLQQWQQLGRRSLFDVMAAEGDHYNLRVAYVNALHDGQQLNALLLSLGRGLTEWLQ